MFRIFVCFLVEFRVPVGLGFTIRGAADLQKLNALEWLCLGAPGLF